MGKHNFCGKCHKIREKNKKRIQKRASLKQRVKRISKALNLMKKEAKNLENPLYELKIKKWHDKLQKAILAFQENKTLTVPYLNNKNKRPRE